MRKTKIWFWTSVLAFIAMESSAIAGLYGPTVGVFLVLLVGASLVLSFLQLRLERSIRNEH